MQFVNFSKKLVNWNVKNGQQENFFRPIVSYEEIIAVFFIKNVSKGLRKPQET